MDLDHSQILSFVRTCRTCGATKDVTEFYFSQGRPRGSCKPCVVEANRASLARRTATADGLRRRKAVQRSGDLRYRYQLTPAEYAALVERAGGRCAVCQREASLQVDHCHATGAVRGLLCGPCNKALGLLRDDVASLRAAIAYLSCS